MSSASFLFSAVFCFGKVTQEIFSELHGTKTEGPIIPSHTRCPKGRRRGATELPHQWRRGSPATQGHGVGPTGLPRGCPFAYKYLFDGKPQVSDQKSTKISVIAVVINPRSRGFGALPGTMSEGRSSPEGSTSPCVPPE